MDYGLILAAIGLPSIISGIFLYFFKRDMDRRAAQATEREDARRQLDVLLVQGINAALAVGEATGRAVKEGTCNGEMTDALEYSCEVKNKLTNFLTERGVSHLR